MHVQASHRICERRSYSALGVERSSVRYISHLPDQTPLVMRIRDLAATRTRYGYFRIYILLRSRMHSSKNTASALCRAYALL